MTKEVTVSVPATTSNLGPGFDCLGLALGLRNKSIVSVASGPPAVEIHGEGAGKLPDDASNLVLQAARRVFQLLGVSPPALNLFQENLIPVSSGLGSSGAAVVAGIAAANALLDSSLSLPEMLALASEIEGHPDNVTPALYGGLTLSLASDRGFVVEKIMTPPMEVVVVLPDFELATSEARAALPKMVPLSDAIFNAGRVGYLLRVLAAGDFGRLALAMEDRLHQPYRLGLIPGMNKAFEAGIQTGAAAVALSGAGPSVVAFAQDNHSKIARSMQQAFDAVGLTSRSWILPIERSGVQVISN